MKYKTLARTLLRVLGVYFVIEGGAQLVGYIGYIVTTQSYASSGRGLASIYWFSSSRSVIVVAAGLYLLFRGKWVVDQIIPGNRPYCHECGYDLTGANGGRCAECGTAFKMADVQPRVDGESSEE
jgi:hypothetical protein